MSNTQYLPADDKQAYMRYFDNANTLWVFAYGSLIWNPGFVVSEQRLSCLHGFHREFCLISTHYRGTPECTGLVLALDHGEKCHGLALLAEGDQVQKAASDLWDREMISYAYLPVLTEIETADGAGGGGGGGLQALTFVMNCNHEQYAGKLSDDEIIARILRAQGTGGTNVDYLLQTAKHLKEWDISDSHIERLMSQVAAKLVKP